MKKIHVIISVIAFIFSCDIFSVYAQTPVNFHHLTEKDGLSYNIINCFFKDSRGILWIGTYNGLNRYDGSHFYVFKKTKDSQSLVHNTVHSVCEDRKGNIWGITDNGIFCYQVNSGKFKNYYYSAEGYTLAGYNILIDRNDNMYADCVSRFLKYNTQNDSFETVQTFAHDSTVRKLWSIQKNGMLADPSGKGVWIATMGGLNYYDAVQKKILNYLDFPDSDLFKNVNVSALGKGDSSHFWIFDNENREMIQFDASAKTITRKIPLKTVLPKAAGATIFEDNNHILWFSSWTFDIITIDYLHENKIEWMRHNESDALSVAGDFFWAGMQDADGTIWLGTAGGISRCNPSKTFYKIHHLPEEIPFLKTHAIGFIAESPADKSWWIEVGGAKAVHYFPAAKNFEVYDLIKALPNQTGVYPSVLPVRFVNDMVVFNTANGPWGWSAKQPFFKPVSLLPAAQKSFSIKDVYQENDSITFFNNGQQLLRVNNKSKKANLIEYDAIPGIKKPLIYWLYTKPRKKPWMLSAEGWLGRLDTNDKLAIIKMPLDKNDKGNTGFFSSLDFDNSGKVWLSKKGYGLYCFDTLTKKLKVWREPEGLVFDHIMTATVDNIGQIWCAAYNKISVLAPEANNFYNFSFPVSTNNYGYVNHSILLSNGNILISMMGDIIEFFPEKLIMKPAFAKPDISLVNINGRDSLLTKQTVLHLEPDENSVTIKFGLLTDGEIFRYSFRYMLEGADKTWINAGDRHEAVYRNLPSGTYTFRLIAEGTNKTWSSAEAILTLIITTPFYKASWFWIIIGLLIAVLLYLFYRNRIRQARQMHSLETKAQLLEKEKALVMYEGLKQQLNPHFLFNSLTSLSSLISADKNVAKDFLESLSKTYRYILKSRESEVVSLADEIKFAQNYVKLQQTRFEKGLLVNFNISEDYAYRKIVPVTMQNMIENAIKHNILDEETPLVINIYTEADCLVIQNNLQKKNFVETSNRQGLSSLQALYHYLTQSPVEILEDEKYFTVKIPLL